ncbi:hypothetical protein [Microvirga sp. Mcv34]|uniref:hypothetical protein n=1 Tax=Microvirga sp. Mcv34 TaxID=2926016 RepID=UPI0021C77D6D|nr:hypothetical protein [Microvirga sp. Mcv34]
MPFSTHAKPASVLALALMIPVVVGSVPAHAEGIFAFLQALTQPAAAPPPAAQPFGYQADPSPERSYQKARPRPKPVVLEQPEVRKPVEPKPVGEIANPVPALLADSTLRAGDMVMFPDGLRVFTGRPGGPHKLTDFKPLAQAAKHLSRETRKLVAHLLPAENVAWNTDAVKSSGMLASNTNDVSTTGSVNRSKSHKDARSR